MAKVECSLCRASIELMDPMADFLVDHGYWYCGYCMQLRHPFEV